MAKKTKVKAKTTKKAKAKKTTAIVKIRSYEISKPDQMVQAAKLIKNYIVKNGLSVQIVNKDYVLVEGWQFAGSIMSLYPRIASVEEKGPNKWLAKVEIINQKTKEVVSTGFALCSKAEQKKASFDEYAILSMAQTRAIGKAFRNTIGWIIKLAGYEATPAEEMKAKPQPKQAVKTSNKAGGIQASQEDKERILNTAKELKLKGKIDEAISKATGLRVDWNHMTKVQASKILFELMQLGAKK